MRTFQAANLPADTVVSSVGIYVVSHHNPPHAPPHEVLIAVPMILPKCKICANVRFRLKIPLPERISENLFFRRAKGTGKTAAFNLGQ